MSKGAVPSHSPMPSSQRSCFCHTQLDPPKKAILNTASLLTRDSRPFHLTSSMGSSSVTLPPSPAPIIKASTQPTFLAPSSLLWPVGDCSAYSRDLHYVSYKSFHTFLVCVCVSSASMLKPTFGWRVLQFLQRHKIVAETLTKKLPDF